MGNFRQKFAMATVAAIASTPLGGVVYRCMRHQKIQPKELQHFSELVPNNEREIHLTAHRRSLYGGRQSGLLRLGVRHALHHRRHLGGFA